MSNYIMMFPKELLLGILTVCCCGVEAVCVLKAQVSGSVTLEWKIPSEMSLSELDIVCSQDQSSSSRNRRLYLQYSDTEEPDYQDQDFRGRVRVERVRGLFRVNISDLSVEDSGSYLCTFHNSDTGRDTSECQLSVSVFWKSQIQPTTEPDSLINKQHAPGPTQGPTEEPPEPPVAGGRERTGLYSALGLLLGLVLLTFALKIKSIFFSAPQKHQTNQAEVV